MTRQRTWLAGLLPLLLAACATTGGGAPHPVATASAPPPASTPHPRTSPYPPAQEDPSKRGDYVAGGLFRPGEPDSVPAEIPDVDAIPEPDVRPEPLAPTGNRDYMVLGQKYRVLDTPKGYVEEGIASYYGNKFHRRRTSSGEVYDMYAFTAAHKTLPLPSFARVTNLENGKSVVVRVNDRGPFHPGRVVDLSYAAAVKLGFRDKGSARVRVEALVPEDADALARTPPASPLDGLVTRIAAPASPATATASTDPAPPTAATPASATSSGIILQIASFIDRRNAERALARLRDAAIDSAHLRDVDIDGRKLWRLQIGPITETASAELASRIAGLGFGPPQRVRD
jgi:rare lipoprotein A